ncbi:MAG: site-specific integrase [Eubacteriales bacterium]
MALKNYKSFPLLEEYLNYLTVIKGRSLNTVIEYRTDILMFLQFMNEKREVDIAKYDLSNIDADYLRTIEPLFGVNGGGR